MTLSLSHFRRRDVRAFAAGLLLAAVLFRAIIPPGYMPDISALQQSLFKITICTAQGAAYLQVGPDGQPPSAKHTVKKICPYLLAGVAFILALNAPQFFSQAFFLLTPVLARVESVPGEKYFGNASPRSPPGA